MNRWAILFRPTGCEEFHSTENSGERGILSQALNLALAHNPFPMVIKITIMS
ncbi:MAG TPA: hypothetical protein VL793_01560 [Patescibacteria group bacterium]|nr:hypothetical protein [Patescibacteria group bacterium]